SPGCVTEPARAGTAVQSDRTPAAANFVNLLFICNSPHRPPGAVVWRTVPLNLTWSMSQDAMSDGDQVGAIATAPRNERTFLKNCCRTAVTPPIPCMALVHHANCRTFPTCVP